MIGYTAKVGLRKPEVLPKWRDMAGIYARVKRLWSIYDDAVAAGDVDTAERARGDINETLGFDREWRTLSERYPEHFPSRHRSVPYDAGGLLPVVSQTVQKLIRREALDEMAQQTAEWLASADTAEPAPFCTRCTSPVCVCGVER